MNKDYGGVAALKAISLNIYRGETLGLVGESGSGKSTLAKTLIQLVRPSSGSLYFQGSEIGSLEKKPLKQLRRKMQIIFQDPYASLNPRMTVREILKEPLEIHQLEGSAEQLLAQVGMNASHLNRFPHEFSGGQRQRIAIARALAVDPEFLICDEPFSALDVSIQAQIVNLLQKVQKKRKLTYLIIAHDLAMIRYLCDRVAVMYRGALMELAPSEELYRNPMHPYTKALLSAVPIPDPHLEKKRSKVILEKRLPLSSEGCPFAHRCPLATTICHTHRPEMELQHQRHVACHHLRA